MYTFASVQPAFACPTYQYDEHDFDDCRALRRFGEGEIALYL